MSAQRKTDSKTNAMAALRVSIPVPIPAQRTLIENMAEVDQMSDQLTGFIANQLRSATPADKEIVIKMAKMLQMLIEVRASMAEIIALAVEKDATHLILQPMTITEEWLLKQ